MAQKQPMHLMSQEDKRAELESYLQNPGSMTQEDKTRAKFLASGLNDLSTWSDQFKSKGIDLDSEKSEVEPAAQRQTAVTAAQMPDVVPAVAPPEAQPKVEVDKPRKSKHADSIEKIGQKVKGAAGRIDPRSFEGMALKELSLIRKILEKSNNVATGAPGAVPGVNVTVSSKNADGLPPVQEFAEYIKKIDAYLDNVDKELADGKTSEPSKKVSRKNKRRKNDEEIEPKTQDLSKETGTIGDFFEGIKLFGAVAKKSLGDSKQTSAANTQPKVEREQQAVTATPAEEPKVQAEGRGYQLGRRLGAATRSLMFKTLMPKQKVDTSEPFEPETPREKIEITPDLPTKQQMIEADEANKIHWSAAAREPVEPLTIEEQLPINRKVEPKQAEAAKVQSAPAGETKAPEAAKKPQTVDEVADAILSAPMRKEGKKGKKGKKGEEDLSEETGTIGDFFEGIKLFSSASKKQSSSIFNLKTTREIKAKEAEDAEKLRKETEAAQPADAAPEGKKKKEKTTKGDDTSIKLLKEVSIIRLLVEKIAKISYDPKMKGSQFRNDKGQAVKMGPGAKDLKAINKPAVVAAQTKSGTVNVAAAGASTTSAASVPPTQPKVEPKQAETQDASQPTAEEAGGLDPTDLLGVPGLGKVASGLKAAGGKVLQAGGSLLKAAKPWALPAAAAWGGAKLFDMGLGKMGVGKDEKGNDLRVNEKQDDANWNKMSFGQKLESALPRGIEKVGGVLGFGNMTAEAKAKRVENESKYLKEQDQDDANWSKMGIKDKFFSGAARINEKYNPFNLFSSKNREDRIKEETEKFGGKVEQKTEGYQNTIGQKDEKGRVLVRIMDDGTPVWQHPSASGELTPLDKVQQNPRQNIGDSLNRTPTPISAQVAPPRGESIDMVSRENAEMVRDQSSAAAVQPVVINNNSSSNSQSFVPIKANPRMDSSFSRYQDRVAAYQ